jgi:hypothetical protein
MLTSCILPTLSAGRTSLKPDKEFSELEELLVGENFWADGNSTD